MATGRSIAVTGTPGAGKTTLSKEIARRFNLDYIDVNEVIKEHGLSEGHDEERDCEIIDPDRLTRKLISLIGGRRCVIDSHLSHNVPREHVKVIVAKCSISELKKRLEDRGYSQAKVRENLDSEIFDVCLTEAEEKGHDILVVETDKEIDYAAIKSFI